MYACDIYIYATLSRPSDALVKRRLADEGSWPQFYDTVCFAIRCFTRNVRGIILFGHKTPKLFIFDKLFVKW